MSKKLSRREFDRALGLGLTGLPALRLGEAHASELESARSKAGIAMPATSKRVTVYGGRPTTVEEATLFSFDDVSMPFRQNLHVKMHQAAKHPANPVVKRGGMGAPDEYRVQYYGSVIRHEGKFKMWYVAGDASAAVADYAHAPFYGFRLAYAESDDGINWIKPNLGLVEYQGNRNNNLLQLEPPELAGLHVVVLYEPEDPDPSKRFKMMFHTRGHTLVKGEEIRSTSIPLFSADGLRWRPAKNIRLVDSIVVMEDMVLPPEHFEQSGLYKWQEAYYLTGQQISPWTWLPSGEQCGRVMTIFRSPDFVHWSSTKSLSYVRYGYRSAPPGEAEEAHEPASVWNRGNVVIGLFGLFHHGYNRTDSPMDLGLLISNDGTHFREPIPDFVFVPRTTMASFDSGGIVSGQGFENVGDQTYIWYGGINGDIVLDNFPDEVGLVTLQRDRFGALCSHTPAEPAAVISCPLKVTGQAGVWVNVNGLSDEARLRVELLDELERPIPGYAGEDAALLRDSGLRQRLRWKQRTEIGDLDKPFRIKVTFEGGGHKTIEFYALYVGRPTPGRLSQASGQKQRPGVLVQSRQLVR